MLFHYQIYRFKYPYLLLLAEKDRVISNSGSKSFHAKSGSTIKTVTVMKDSYHELQKEPNKDEFNAHVLRFIADRLKDKARLKPLGDITHKQFKCGYLDIRRKMFSKRKVAMIVFLFYLIIGVL